MKLEILKKLIALANNNPNDNEANLAARKVCKALIEHKFVITGGTTEPPKSTRPPSQSASSRDPFYQRASEANFWEEVFGDRARQRKQRESEYEKNQEDFKTKTKYKPKSETLIMRETTWQYEYFVAANRTYYNPIHKMHFSEMFQDQWYRETGSKHPSDTATFRSEANYGNPYGSTAQKEYYRKQRTYDGWEGLKDKAQKEKIRKLKCKTCGNVFTRFVGFEQIYECNNCQWSAYEREKNENQKSTEASSEHVCHYRKVECKTPVTCAGMGCQMRT